MLWTPSVLVLLPALAWRLTSPSAVTALDLQSRQATDTSTLPSCVQGCINTLQTCQTTDACFCDESSVTSPYTSCLQTQCTTSEDRIAGQRFHSESCSDEQATRNGEPYLIGVTWAYFGLTVIFVTLRLVSRWPGVNGSGYDWDDYVIILAFVLLIPLDVSLDQEARLGLGQDMWFNSTSSISRILHWFYASEILYICVVMLAKVAIVLLYLRIWTADSVTKPFRLACWITIGLCIATMLAFVFGTIFQCEPISYAWNYISGDDGNCIQVAPMLFAFAALDIVYNIIVFLLPVPSLRKLQIGWSKKLALSTVFGVGALVTIFSIVRIGFLARSDRESNATWYYHWVGLWSIIEANLSVICVCAPATVGLVQRWMTGGVREADDDWVNVNGSFTRQMAIRGPLDSDDGSPDLVPAEISRNGFGDAENAFRQDQEEGRYSESLIDKPGENMSTTDSASMMSRNRAGEQPLYRSAPGDGTALQYRPQSGSSTNRVEISHEPPTQPAEAHLSYRDENDIYHEVIVTDIPHGRHRPIHPSRSRMRPSNLRALAEDELDQQSGSGSEPSANASSNIPSSQMDSTRSSDPQGNGVPIGTAPQSPPKSPIARSASPPVSQITADSIDGGVASGIFSRPKSYSQRPVSQIARTPSLASATIEATEVAAKTPSPPFMSPPASGSSHSIATQTEDTELSPAPSIRPKQQRSQEVLFSPRSLSPNVSERQYTPLKAPSMGTQTDEEDMSPVRGAHHNSSMNNGIEVSPMLPRSSPPPPSGRWEWPSEPDPEQVNMEPPRGRSPPPEMPPRDPSIESVDRAVQADIPTPEDEVSPIPRPAGYRDSATNMDQDFGSPGPQDFYPTTRSPSRSPMQTPPGVPDQYAMENIAPFTHMNQVRSPSRSPTRSPVPLTDESANITTSEEVKFRGRSPPRREGSIVPAPRSASSAALRSPPVLPRMVDAGNQTDEEDDDFIDDRPQTLSPPRGREQMPSLSPTVSQLDLPYASRNMEAEMRKRSRSPLPNYPYHWQNDGSRSRSRPASGELLPSTTYKAGPPTTYNVGWQRDSPHRSPSGQRSPQPMFWDGPAIKEDIGNAFAEQPYQHEMNESREWRSPGPYNRDENGSREWGSQSPYYREKNDWRSPSPRRNGNRSPPRFLSPLPGPDYDNMGKGPRTASSQAVPVYRIERNRSMSPTAWQAGVPPEPEYYEQPEESPFAHYQKEQEWRPPSPTSMMSGILPDEAHGREFRSPGMSPLREDSRSRSRSRPGMGRRIRSRSLIPSRSPPQERSYSAESIQSQNKDTQTSPDDEYPPLDQVDQKNNRSASVQTDDLPSPPEGRPNSQGIAVRPHLSPLQPMDRLRTPGSSKDPSPQQTLDKQVNDHSNRSPPKSRSPSAANRSRSVEGGTQTDSDWEDRLEDGVAMDFHIDDHSDRSPPKSRSPPHQRSTSADAGMQTDSDWEEHLDKVLNEAQVKQDQPKYADNAQSPGFPDMAPLSMRDHSASPAHSPYPLPPHGYELMNDIPVHGGQPVRRGSASRNDGRGRSPPPAHEAYPSPRTGIPRMPSIEPADEMRLDGSPRRNVGGLHDKYMDDEDGYVGDRDATPDDYFRGIAGLSLRSPSESPQREEYDEDDEDDWQPPRPGEDFDYEIPKIPPELLAQLVDASTSKYDEDRSPSPPRTNDPTMAAMAQASADRALNDERSPSPGLRPSVSSLALPFHGEQGRSGPPSPGEVASHLSRTSSAALSPSRPSNMFENQPYDAQIAALNERSPGDSGFPSPSALGHRSPSPGDLAARLAEATRVPDSKKASPMPSPHVASPYKDSPAGTPDGEKDALPNWGATPWHDARSPGDSPLESPDEAAGVSIHRGESYQGPPPAQYTAGTDMNTPGSEFIPTRPVSQMMVPTLGRNISAASSPRVPASPDMEKDLGHDGSASAATTSVARDPEISKLIDGLVSRSPSPPVEKLGREDEDDEPIASHLDEPRTGDLADNSRSPSILADRIDRNRDSLASTPGSDFEAPFESGLFNEAGSRSVSPPVDRMRSGSESEREPSRAASPVEKLAQILRTPTPQSEREEPFSAPTSPRVEEIGSEMQDSPMLARQAAIRNVDPADRDDYDSVAPRSPSPVQHEPEFVNPADRDDYDSVARSRLASAEREQRPAVSENDPETEESEEEAEPEPSPMPPKIQEAPQSDADDTDIEEGSKDSNFPTSSLPFPVRQAMCLLQPKAKTGDVARSVNESGRSPSPAKSKYVDHATAITPMEKEEPEMSRRASDLRLDDLPARSPSPDAGPTYVDSATATTFEEARPEVPPSDWEQELDAVDADARSQQSPVAEKYVDEATVAALERGPTPSPTKPNYVDQTTATTLEEDQTTRDLAIDALYTRSIEENDLPTASLLAEESRKRENISEVDELPTASALADTKVAGPEEMSQFSKTSSEEDSLFSRQSKVETEDSSRPGSYPSNRSDSADSGSLPSLSKSHSRSPPPQRELHTPEPAEDASRPVSQLAVPTLSTITESPPASEPEIKNLDLSPMEQAQEDADSNDAETRPTSMYFSPLSTPGVQPSNVPTPKFVSALATPTEEYFEEEAAGTRTPTAAASEKFSFPARGLSPASNFLGQRLGSPHPEVDRSRSPNRASRGASAIGLELPFSGEQEQSK
ncbi:hypothetical protein AC578_846 [Pseudocercospora eumusae]|uniref:Rhodopsin domain-containing protein n=1 Tax=Pseudocercospora eumusae TaxID=321146 RepID=A0A139H414_9PEZI|nr:hypothetical protein AC578_846 [Pseudocercospora eumusae]